MVSSAILNPAAVAEEYELKKSAYSQLPADSYMCMSLTRGDRICPRVPGVFLAEGVARMMVGVVRERETRNRGRLPSQRWRRIRLDCRLI